MRDLTSNLRFTNTEKDEAKVKLGPGRTEITRIVPAVYDVFAR
jgi:hypothetical protein